MKKDCWYCKSKFQCYDRMMKGRTSQCHSIEEKYENLKNWKWFELYAETPEDRERARKDYINFSKMLDK